jgi:ADP-ribose pyrophosphatase YjhB (NUDIX family)
MNAELQYYLSRHEPGPTQEVNWGDGIQLEVTGYLVHSLPPEPFVSSVRAIILRDDEILVFRDHNGTAHILPGGRLEAGETIMDTLDRELLEETGWTVANPRIFGLLHFRHLNIKSPDYSYPYPDFVHPIFLASANEYHPDRITQDKYVTETRFVSLHEARSLKLPTAEAVFLRAILEGRN